MRFDSESDRQLVINSLRETAKVTRMAADTLRNAPVSHKHLVEQYEQEAADADRIATQIESHLLYRG